MTYVKRQIQLHVSESQNGENAIIKRGDRFAKFDSDVNLAEAKFEKFVLTLPVVDRDLMEGSSIAAARMLILETDTELTLKLADIGDTGITVMPISAVDATIKRGTIYLEGDFARVFVTIAGTGEAVVLIGVVGA